MESTPLAPIDPEVLSALRRRLPEGSESLTLEDFIDCVLYDSKAGYYCREKDRVGYRDGTDFYTASSMGGVFSGLVLASIRKLLGDALEDYTFVEAGPESPKGILGEMDEIPFKETRLIRPGEPFTLPAKAVVFSNELFDAQPFRRFKRQGNQWRECGVTIKGDRVEPCLMDLQGVLPDLPAHSPEGYVIDWPGKAHELMQSIGEQSWSGLFIAFDYGLDRSTVLEERPQGTGRTYFQHKMGSDLLQNPGHTDITCHLIWDNLEEILEAHRFQNIHVQRQESFFMKNAEAFIGQILAASPVGFSPQKQSLMELLHPGNMGHKFQVLSARRFE